MNDDLRKAIRLELARQDMSQNDLAKELGVSHQYVSAVMTGAAANIPKTWANILDTLGLQLTAIPKGADVVIVPPGARVVFPEGEGTDE
ncbi:MAG: helix-turn-helix transcriptional regulator [Trueperaceae bacterium]|nr:helix-turn-helix transcriptional regulator [Trueperaceae bacterium]